jgi:hypothetical protein
MGAGQKANIPEEPPTSSRDQERHKCCEQEWGDEPTSQKSLEHPAEIWKSTKAESGGGVTGQSPKGGQVVDP